MTSLAGDRGAALRPILLAMIAAAVWGLWWIPIRWLETQGLPGALGGAVMSGGAALGCLCWMLFRGGVYLSPRAVLGACLAGAAVASYSSAINHSDVVRVVLLFYLAPAWSKLIEWGVFGMAWRWTSSVALIAAGVGAYLVLGGNVGGLAMNFGDMLALGSGLAWALGAALVFSDGRSDPVGLTFGTCGFAALCGALLFLVEPVAGDMGLGLVPVFQGIGIGLVYVLPVMLITLWSAQRLAPALLSFLLTAEILAGVLSGVLLLQEPFSALQGLGAVLIVFGAVAEILPAVLARRRAERRQV